LSSVNEGLADVADIEDGGGLDIVPVLAGEGVNAKVIKKDIIRLTENKKVVDSDSPHIDRERPKSSTVTYVRDRLMTTMSTRNICHCILQDS
jgi:hypothetical protein